MAHSLESEYESEKYFTTVENLKNTLDTFGVAIVPNVLNEEECDEGYNKMWEYFEHITKEWEKPLKKDDTSTYRSFWDLFPVHSMLVQHWNAGHAQYVWDIRQNEKAINTYSKGIWGCENEDLLVSFDAVSMHLPPEITNRGWYKGNRWYHTDQSFLRPDFECIQSYVTLKDVNVGDATLTIMESSHKYHTEFKEEFNVTEKRDWYILNENEERFYTDRGCNYKRIYCPKGSMVFWDSRTIHSGTEPLKTRKKSNFRSIVYLCYMPRSTATKANLKKKQKAFNELRMTSHWPNKSKLFAKNPRTYGKKIPDFTPIDPPILNELGMKMAGF